METLSLEEALQLFVQIIVEDLTHQDYQRTVDKAILYRKLCTGDDIDDLFVKAPREDNISYMYKLQVAIAITPAVISSVMKPFNKVPRNNGLVKKVIAVKKDGDEADANAADEVIAKMATFYGSENNINGLDYFMQSRYIELGFTDPNAWIVTEFDSVDGDGKPEEIYPYEVSSENARHFGIKNNILQWFVFREDNIYLEPYIPNADEAKYNKTNKITSPSHTEMNGFKWVMVIADHTIIFNQVGSDEVALAEDDENYDQNLSVKTLANGNRYAISIYNHLTGVVPAKRVGYKRDLSTDGRTFVAPYDDAMFYLLGSFKTVSEFELTKADHVYPKMMQYVPPCPGESETNSCFNGRAGLGGVCRVCNGSGKMPIHTSAQDVITIKLPDDPAQMVDLNKLLAYFSPPMELVMFQNELVRQISVDCHQTIFNSTVFLKDVTGQAVVEETATGKNIDLDSVNDTLAPFAEGFSAFWLFEAYIIAKQTDNGEKVELLHRFPSDFKMKTLNDLYIEMKTANDSYAPPFLIEMLNDDIAMRKFQDDPDLLQMYEVKKRLNPFRGKTDVEIQNALNTDYTPYWKKVLSVNFEDILTQAEILNKDFYLDDYEKQLVIVRELTDKMILEIEATKVTPTLKPIAGPQDGVAIYAVGDIVTITDENVSDPTHIGVKFKVDEVAPSGDTFTYKLTSEDGEISATYVEADIN